MSKFKTIKRIAWPMVRNTFIGGMAGGLAGRMVSDAMGADAGQEKGTKVGAIVGATLGLPFGRLARGGQKLGATLAMGMKARNPESKVAAAILATDKGIDKGRVIFRKIRGHIRPIRVKGA